MDYSTWNSSIIPYHILPFIQANSCKLSTLNKAKHWIFSFWHLWHQQSFYVQYNHLVKLGMLGVCVLELPLLVNGYWTIHPYAGAVIKMQRNITGFTWSKPRNVIWDRIWSLKFTVSQSAAVTYITHRTYSYSSVHLAICVKLIKGQNITIWFTMHTAYEMIPCISHGAIVRAKARLGANNLIGSEDERIS